MNKILKVFKDRSLTTCHLICKHESFLQRIEFVLRYRLCLPEEDWINTISQSLVECPNVEVEPLINLGLLLGTGGVQLTGLVLGHEVGHGGATLGDDEVPVGQDGDGVLGVEGQELGGLGPALQHGDGDEGVLQAQQIQGHVD